MDGAARRAWRRCRVAPPPRRTLPLAATSGPLGDRVDVLMEDLDKVTYLVQMASEALPQLDTGCDKARAALWAADVGIARLNDSLACLGDEVDALKAAEVRHG